MVDEEHADAAACSILVTEKRETHAEHLGCVGHMHAVVCSGHTHTLVLFGHSQFECVNSAVLLSWEDLNPGE